MVLISPHGNDNRMKSAPLPVCPGLNPALRQDRHRITEDLGQPWDPSKSIMALAQGIIRLN